MLASEFPEFESVIRRLEKVFAKKIDDETMQAYWGALKDQHVMTFKRFAERHEKFSKFFPKPCELRAKEDKLPPVGGDDALRAVEDIAIRSLEKLRHEDLNAWFKIMGDRNAARIVRTHGNDAVWYDLKERCWRV